jgi:hypothetical protein
MQKEKFPVEVFTGGDMKSACILYGINASNSHQPCIYCKWNKTAILDYDAEWPITRTIQVSIVLPMAQIFQVQAL